MRPHGKFKRLCSTSEDTPCSPSEDTPQPSNPTGLDPGAQQPIQGVCSTSEDTPQPFTPTGFNLGAQQPASKMLRGNTMSSLSEDFNDDECWEALQLAERGKVPKEACEPACTGGHPRAWKRLTGPPDESTTHACTTCEGRRERVLRVVWMSLLLMLLGTWPVLRSLPAGSSPKQHGPLRAHHPAANLDAPHPAHPKQHGQLRSIPGPTAQTLTAALKPSLSPISSPVSSPAPSPARPQVPPQSPPPLNPPRAPTPLSPTLPPLNPPRAPTPLSPTPPVNPPPASPPPPPLTPPSPPASPPPLDGVCLRRISATNIYHEASPNLPDPQLWVYLWQGGTIAGKTSVVHQTLSPVRARLTAVTHAVGGLRV